MRYTLYLNGENISSYVKSVKSSIKFNKNRFIGNAPSEEFKIELNNTASYFDGIKLKGVFTLYKGDTLFKTLKVYEQPEKLFKDLSLTLYDSMVETNIRYDTDVVTYPKKIRAQLDEMSALSGVRFDYSLLPSEVLETEVNFYDNTQLIRTYLRWIAELGCCNVFSQSNGAIKFIPFNAETQLEITEDKHIYEFETEEVYVCSGIFMEYLNLSEGTEDNHVYRLIKDNPYITTIEHVKNIFSKIEGLTFVSVKNLKTRYVDGLFLGNKANYKEYFSFVPFEMEIVYHAGDLSHDTCTISGRYSTEAEEEYINTPTLKDRVRRVEINVDQNSQSLQIISQNVDDNKEKIAQLTVSNEEIKSEVSKKVGDDEIVSKINQSAEEIKIQSSKLTLEGIITANGNVKILEDGSIVVNNGTFTGDVVGASFYCENTSTYTYTVDDIDAMADLYFSEVPPTKEQLARYDINQNGHIDSQDGLIIQKLLQGKYGNTNGVATFTDTTSINVDGFGKLVLERKLNGTTITRTEYNSGSINKIGGNIMIDGEPVITEISGTIARFG